MTIKIPCRLLYIQAFDFTDDSTGRRISGCKVTCVLPEQVQTDSGRGFPVVTWTGDYVLAATISPDLIGKDCLVLVEQTRSARGVRERLNGVELRRAAA